MAEKLSEVEIYKKMQGDPIFFVRLMYGLRPQEVLPEYEDKLLEAWDNQDYDDITLDMFEPFVEGKMITWQQHELLQAVKAAVNGEGKKKISARSGHGCGKTAVLSWTIIWFLYTHLDARVPCTAPASYQINDVLRPEIKIWLDKLPPGHKELFERQKGFIRVKERPEYRFARARPGDKDNAEALAGLHSKHMLLVTDEASGVAEEVFNTAKGAMTDDSSLLIMMGNPTRLEGYFYKSHTELSESFHLLNFSSIQSPIVGDNIVKEIAAEHGTDSDEYRIRILGMFPKVEGLDDKGYVPLVLEHEINRGIRSYATSYTMLGVDPAGQGKDETMRIARNRFQTEVLGVEKTSTDMSIALKTLTLLGNNDGIKDEDVYIDSFGVGANVGMELAIALHKCTPYNWSQEADESDKFANKRAECYWRLREWVKQGGEFVDSELTRKKMKDLLMIKYKRDMKGKILIMPKEEMRKIYKKSPDGPDALALTFKNRESKGKSRIAVDNRPVRNYVTGELMQKSLSKNY